jgi:hypothetical protein
VDSKDQPITAAPKEFVLTLEQGDALFEGLGSLMTTLRFEARARSEITDAEHDAADREHRRWEGLREDLAEQGCDTPARSHATERSATIRIREDRDWLAESALRALTGAARLVQLTIENPLRVSSPLDQIKTQIEVLQGLESLLDALGWPLTIPLAPAPFPWPVFSRPIEE